MDDNEKLIPIFLGKTRQEIKDLYMQEPYKVNFIDRPVFLVVYNPALGVMKYIFNKAGKCTKEKDCSAMIPPQ